MIRTKQIRKWKIPHTALETRTLCFSSCKNRRLKTKLERKKKWGHFLYRLFCLKGFFWRFVLSQCILYWTKFQTIPTFTYQKPLLHTLLLLVSKIVECFQCILTFMPLSAWINQYCWRKYVFQKCFRSQLHRYILTNTML